MLFQVWSHLVYIISSGSTKATRKPCFPNRQKNLSLLESIVLTCIHQRFRGLMEKSKDVSLDGILKGLNIEVSCVEVQSHVGTGGQVSGNAL